MYVITHNDNCLTHSAHFSEVGHPIKIPVFTLNRKDSPDSFIWRVRNLTSPECQVIVEVAERKIVIRTSDRKYFKKFDIPGTIPHVVSLTQSCKDMDRKSLPFDEKSLSFTYEHGTLLIKYKKPKSILDAETEAKAERMKMKPQKDGAVDCNTQ